MDMKRFEIKPQHLKLLQRFNVGWDDCEFGAPEIDPKRPYGNSSVHQDMLEILGIKELKEGIYEFELDGRKWLLKGEDKYNVYLEGADEEDLLDELNKLHKEMETALQICLFTQKFETGIFESEEYSDRWKKV
jgi:hypothetical protein